MNATDLPERQFDFWCGTWDLTWADGGRGTNRVEAIFDGKVILENFAAEPAGSFDGMSVSVYNAAQGKWQQTWVDNQGGYLDFVGEYHDGRMILAREVTPGEPAVQQRMVFYNIDEHELDWNWERSTDVGRTWELQWHIHYQRASLRSDSSREA
jgi:hypothetical protein